MNSDLFFSPTTRLYVSRKPLSVNARVKAAAEQAEINLDWNDEGIINNINFDQSKKLMHCLGAKILTPIEYWAVFNDAVKANDEDMVSELCSSKYAEWLDRVYLSENRYIDSPKVQSAYKYVGEVKKSLYPHGRPGWFNPESNIGITGEPLHVEHTRKKFASSWKYWSPDLSVTKLGACAPIRGYVTSVGKPSYDLGIPVDSRQPKLMIRECRSEPLLPTIDAAILAQAETAIGQTLIRFIEEQGQLFSTSKDSLIYKMRESFLDQLGDMALNQNISKATSKICKIKDKQLKYSNFVKFIQSSKRNLKQALASKKDIVFVMGHKNPDTDTVISSLFEAYRNHLMDVSTIYVPIVQSEVIPDEIFPLLGDVSNAILLSNDLLYATAKKTGLVRWISVDQNREPEVQKYFISIIDHHLVCESAKHRDIPKTLEMLGSTAALITRKYLGMGLEFDPETARILYGATLMDTENRVEHKMTPTDARLMDYLKEKARVPDDNLFYGELMSCLLNTDNAELLFKRDYKEDWGFGFAVAKIKGGFSEEGHEIKKNLVRRLYKLAVQNNIDKNLPLTLLKITDYKEDNKTVNRERLYLVFNKSATIKFKKTLSKALESIIEFEFPDDNLIVKEKYIEFWGGGMQLSRKKTAPVVEPITAAFNRYFLSPSIGKWVKRDFQRKTGIINGKYSTDREGRINNITYEEAKSITKNTKSEMLSLNEYWEVLRDAKKVKDVQMIQSLQGTNFVEFLDSTIINKTFLQNHNTKRIKINVPLGNPGLIHPDEVDLKTGLPTNVRLPNEYGNPELWRYWEPDANLVVLCRSYIFLLDQPCLDGKFHPGESFPNLGLRPVVRKVICPEVKVRWDKDQLIVTILEEKETREWKWPKRIWNK